MRPSSAPPTIQALVAKQNPNPQTDTTCDERTTRNLLSTDPSRVAYWDKRLTTNELSMAAGDWVQGRTAEFQQLGLAPDHAQRTIGVETREADSRLIASVIAVLMETIIGGANLSPAKVIDIGLGTGDFAAALAPFCHDLGWQYIGVDESRQALRLTEHRLRDLAPGVELRQGSAGALSSGGDPLFRLATADLVVWGRVGEHIPDTPTWTAALRESSALLKKSGHFLLFESMQELNERFRRFPSKHQYTYIRSLREYRVALPDLRLATCRTAPYCGEQICITIWQKDQETTA